MQIISAFMIKMVADSGGGADDFRKKHMSRMKEAVETENYRDFIEGLYWELVPDGQLFREWTGSSNKEYAYNCYQEGWSGGNFQRGCSSISGGVPGVAGCLGVSEGYFDTPAMIQTGTNAVLNYASIEGGSPQNSLNMYVEDYDNGFSVSHALIVKNTIPILNYSDRQTYVELVTRYCQTKSESDYNAIDLLLKSSMYFYGLPG